MYDSTIYNSYYYLLSIESVSNYTMYINKRAIYFTQLNLKILIALMKAH